MDELSYLNIKIEKDKKRQEGSKTRAEVNTKYIESRSDNPRNMFKSIRLWSQVMYRNWLRIAELERKDKKSSKIWSSLVTSTKATWLLRTASLYLFSNCITYASWIQKEIALLLRFRFFLQLQASRSYEQGKVHFWSKVVWEGPGCVRNFLLRIHFWKI